MMRIISQRDGEDRDGLQKRIAGARVPDRAASVYTESVVGGDVLLVVEAGFKPLGARKTGLKILAETNTLPTNLESQDFTVAKLRDHAPRVMKDHPRFLTPSPDPDHIGGPLSDQFGFSMVAATRKRTSAMSGRKLMFPFAALKSGRKANSAIRGGAHYSRMFWPMKLVTNAPRRRSAIRGGGTPFSRLLGLPTTSR